MTLLAVLFVVLTVLAVAAIALVSVGGATARLARTPPRTRFDLDEAVDFAAGRLPAYAAGQLTYDELRDLIGWHLDYFEAKGVAAEDDEAGAVERPVVAEDDEGLAFVLGRAAAAGFEVDDVAVVQALEEVGRYLEAIGAVGPVVGRDGSGRTGPGAGG